MFWVVGFVVLLYVVDDVYVLLVSYFVNCNVLFVIVFGLSCVFCYFCWCEDVWCLGVWFVLVCLVLFFLLGELGVLIFVYFFVYVVCFECSDFRSVFVFLVFLVFVVGFWLVVYCVFGFGLCDLGYYVDLVGDLVGFFILLIDWLSVFLFG